MNIVEKKLVYIVENGNIFSAEVTDGGRTITIENQDDCSLNGERCRIVDGYFYLYEGSHQERGNRDEACPIPGHLGDEYVTFDVADAQKEAFKQRVAMKPVAVLSTTVLPVDGTYQVRTVDPKTVDIRGVPHYVGHPDTKVIIEALGAVPAESKLFLGLQVGEVAVCFSIAQGKSTRATDGFTRPHQEISFNDLTCRVIRRVF